MTEESMQLGCNACQVALKGPADAGPEDMLSCPSCGLTEKFETVQREVGDWIKDVMMHGLQEGIGSAVRGNEFVKFTPSKQPKKVYRFCLVQGEASE